MATHQQAFNEGIKLLKEVGGLVNKQYPNLEAEFTAILKEMNSNFFPGDVLLIALDKAYKLMTDKAKNKDMSTKLLLAYEELKEAK